MNICSICKRFILFDDISFCLRCDSAFHTPHIIVWLGLRPFCPMCKVKYKPRKYYPRLYVEKFDVRNYFSNSIVKPEITSLEQRRSTSNEMSISDLKWRSTRFETVVRNTDSDLASLVMLVALDPNSYHFLAQLIIAGRDAKLNSHWIEARSENSNLIPYSRMDPQLSYEFKHMNKPPPIISIT